ncbi:RICIN domain-containing protein [Marixanthomonas spongiae]|uniref:Ricin B lectin domain-containing protein n=1 Tax=Marixanthomonas spongiae TaxID=2174845 RepID=A0A2U0HWT9_9FLAO|nr:RICIN domain-containing protein [Marixanthomonas spongiae]PVW13200.1 hypothetical protein DDV96_13920 [Marixanthomonas spongiae]
METRNLYTRTPKNVLLLKWKRYSLLVIALLVSFGASFSAIAQEYAFIKIEDSSEKPKAVVAGNTYDGKMYQQELKNRDNGKWQFIPTGDGYYNIVDVRHGKAIVAGDRQDNNVYHQDANNRDNAKWKLVKRANNKFHIIDKKHGKALVGGNVFDGNLYHQDPGLRSNALWNLTVIEGIHDRIAPKEIVLFEKHLNTVYDIDKKVLDNNSSPKTSTLSAKYTNNTTRDQTQEISESTQFANSETWETTESISNKIWTEITAQVGWKAGSGGGMEATVSNTLGFGNTTTNTKSKGGSATVTTTISFKTNTVVPAGKTTICKQLIRSEKASVPFVTTVIRTYGDRSTKEVEIPGVWKGTLISRNEVTCTEN